MPRLDEALDGTSHPFPHSPQFSCPSLNFHVRRSILVSVAQFPSLNSHVRRFKCFPLRIQPQVDQCSQSQQPRSQSPELVYGRSALSEFSKWISAVSHSYCAVSHQSLPRLDKAPDGTSIFMSFAPIFMSVAIICMSVASLLNFLVRRFYLHVRRFKCFPLRIQPQMDLCSQSSKSPLLCSQSPELATVGIIPCRDHRPPLRLARRNSPTFVWITVAQLRWNSTFFWFAVPPKEHRRSSALE